MLNHFYLRDTMEAVFESYNAEAKQQKGWKKIKNPWYS